MLIKLVTYFKFLLKSTNQHGVHSPFVFNYLTKCLYKKPRKSKDKTLDILLKTIAYFNFKRIKIIGNSKYAQEVNSSYKNINFDANKKDILFFESIIGIEPNQLFSDYKLHNESLLIFNNINEDSPSKSKWLELIKSKKISVSIDMYYCGILFIRMEQQKEHFMIRI